MAVEIESTLDKASLVILSKLSDIVKDVRSAVEEAIEETGKHIIEEWQAASDSSSVPGDFSESFKRKKAHFNLHTEDFQRLGKSDARSYYNNLEVERFGDSWFVGIKSSKPAYTIKYLPNNQFEVVSTTYSLADVAEKLEMAHPLWKLLAQQGTEWLSDRAVMKLTEKFAQYT